MDFSTFLTAGLLILLVIVLWRIWRVVSSPLPLEMQEALERKTEAKLGLLKDEWSKRLSDELKQVWEQVQRQVQTTDQSVSHKLEEANRTFANVKEELGRLKMATEEVEKVGRDISSLQELLRAPKLRGGIGEAFLADLLSQIMPSHLFSLQHEFIGGERVDAVVRLGGKLVPVDAKFPLEGFRKLAGCATDEERSVARKNFLKDVKVHIDAIASKYIRPQEGTFDFALMYIPAENVYYESILREDASSELFEHAMGKKVIPVSPNSFYAYLLVIVFGLRGFSVEQRSKEILGTLIHLQQEFDGVREDFELTGKQLRNALGNFEKAERHMGRFQDRLEAVEAPRSDPAESLDIQSDSERKVEFTNG